MGSGLLPVGVAAIGSDGSRFGVAGLGGPATARAVLQGWGEGLLGLALEGLLEQFGAEVVAESADELLEVGEGSAPGGPFGAVEVVEQVFGGALEHGTQVGGNLYRRYLLGHLELLSAVAWQGDSGLVYPIL
jgi:hypothetical protein